MSKASSGSRILTVAPSVQDGNVREYGERLWRELVALAVAIGVVFSILTVFTKGGLYISIPGGLVVFVIGFAIANARAVMRVAGEKTAIDAHVVQLSGDVGRLTAERDEARARRDVLEAASVLLRGQTNPAPAVIIYLTAQTRRPRRRPTKKGKALPPQAGQPPRPLAEPDGPIDPLTEDLEHPKVDDQ